MSSGPARQTGRPRRRGSPEAAGPGRISSRCRMARPCHTISVQRCRRNVARKMSRVRRGDDDTGPIQRMPPVRPGSRRRRALGRATVWPTRTISPLVPESRRPGASHAIRMGRNPTCSMKASRRAMPAVTEGALMSSRRKPRKEAISGTMDGSSRGRLRSPPTARMQTPAYDGVAVGDHCRGGRCRCRIVRVTSSGPSTPRDCAWPRGQPFPVEAFGEAVDGFPLLAAVLNGRP